jgi:pyruvate/2-oxoglutarate dehydrogenase complex dihydrolipoamide acyltransferase (E2) component
MAHSESQRSYTIHPFPLRRRAVTAAMRAGRRLAPIHGLVEIDVTDVRPRLRGAEPPLSMTAYVVATVARAAAMHPEVHAYREWRGRLVIHRHVAVTTMIEVPTDQGPFALAHVVHDADTRSVADLSEEIRGISADPNRSATGRALMRTALPLARIPGGFALMYRIMRQSIRVRQRVGTVAVSSVGMFGGGSGHGIGFPTLMSTAVLVGGISQKAMVVDGRVVPREVMDLTVTIDHNVVDGAPAARFGADLRRMLEEGTALE